MKNTLVLSTLLVITGCGAGSGAGLDVNGVPANTIPPTDQTSEVSLAILQTTIFGAICSRCHTGASAPHGLRLDSEENSYAFLVGHASDESPALLRVSPGKPDESYIVKKIEGDASIVGSRMPLGGPYLSAAQIESIRDWITNGAPRAGTGSAATGISRIAAEKTGDDVVAQIHFSRSIQLQTIGADAIQASYKTAGGEVVSVETFFDVVSEKNLEIRLAIPPNAGSLDINMNNSSADSILDSQGKAIDGDNDGIEGGSFHYVQKL